MSVEPSVVIAEASEARAIRPGVFASVLVDASHPTQARSVVIVPTTLHVFESGRSAWDFPGWKTSMVGGRVSHVDESGATCVVTLLYRGGRARIAVDSSAPVLLLRPGSRLALLSPHAAFVFGRPPVDSLSDSVRNVIVGDGTLALPF